MSDYISCGIWKESFTRPPLTLSFKLVERMPISRIKIDKRLFSFQNEVDPSQVDFICENFDQDFWMPIIITPDNYLLDGQHRLQAAKKLGLKFIDAIIEEETEKKHHAKDKIRRASTTQHGF